MDVVYILGAGSLANNEELRYSLRSLALHMQDLGKLYVVGEKPDFLDNFTHIPAQDIYTEKWKNAHSKTRLACSLGQLSEEFLLMNDDHFMLEPFKGSEWPFYALADSSGGVDGPNSFHIHCPIRLKKEWYLALPLDLEAKGVHSPRTFYSNFYKAPPTFCNDFILNVRGNAFDFAEQAVGFPCASISNTTMLNEDFIYWLVQLYPEPSKYERSLLVGENFFE